MKRIVTVITTLVFLGACGQAPQAGKINTTSSNSRDGSNLSCTGDGCFQAKPQKAVAVISHRQIMPSFQGCLGLQSSQLSATTTTTYKDSLTTFSLEGNAKDISAPMMLSIMNVVSEMCLDLINVEKNMATGRKFFPGFTLGGATNTQTYNLDKTIQDLASSCWGRQISSAELAIINKDIANQKTVAAALYACTAVLSSAEAVKF